VSERDRDGDDRGCDAQSQGKAGAAHSRGGTQGD
jgi:hypothetical protein